MISIDIPNDEELQILDFNSFDFLDSVNESDFEELIELAAILCNCSLSYISIRKNDRYWYKAGIGTHLMNKPKLIPFYINSLLKDKLLEVEDVRKDKRLINCSLEFEKAGILFFAVTPIISSSGAILGTLCVMNRNPGKLSTEKKEALVILAGRVTKVLEFHKKNLVIREMAEEIIEMKNKAIEKTLTEYEDANKIIASTLHENVAQSIAGCIHYLKLAKNNHDNRFQQILTVEKELGLVLKNIRKLSFSIAPNTMEWMPVEDLIQDFTQKIYQSFPFSIQFSAIGNKSSIHSENALFIMRIIEHWLKNLKEIEGISLVKLTIKTDDQFEILIEDNGPVVSYEELKEEVFDSLVFEMVRSQGGVIDLCHLSGGNLLQIVLPNNEI